ncbi:MAG: hypothetical protein Q8928_02005 [Bacteroidota bacterium]|nr:hypothetical protein [Bacteroidota bacterium]
MELKSKKLFITALARDCETNLVSNINHINKLRTFFAESYILIVENDSKDNTKSILNDWSLKEKNIKIISNNYGTKTIPVKAKGKLLPGTSYERISKMTKYRNIYLDYLNTLNESIDYVLIIDIDIAFFSTEGIMKAIQNSPKDWGALFAYGTSRLNLFGMHLFPIFYDTYAYLGEKEDFNNLKQSSKRRRHLQRTLSIKLLFKKYFKCKSSFGGIAIYKRVVLTNIKYQCIPNKFNTDSEVHCEHLPLNYDIIQKGYNNYICKDLEVKYGNYNINFLIDFLLFNIPSIIFKKF